MVLGARCYDCRTHISARYPLIELTTGVLFALAALTWGPTLESVKWSAFLFLMLGLIFTDLDTRILPDEFTLGGIALGVAAAALVPFRGGLLFDVWPEAPPALLSMLESAAAAAFVSGTMWLIAALYSKVRGKEGLGFGDVKMVAMMGAFLGLSKALLAIFIGCTAGSVLGLAYIYWRKKDPSTYELPFGSFLGAAGIVVSFLR
jgi:leader peptidase (prepilin peptidase)/N-methyltransferase